MNLDAELPYLWFESADNTRVPAKDPNYDYWPSAAEFAHIAFVGSITHEIYSRDGKIYGGYMEIPEDLAEMLVRNGYRYNRAVLIAGEACPRCAAAIRFRYGSDEGQIVEGEMIPEDSEQYRTYSGPTCRLCVPWIHEPSVEVKGASA